MNRRMEKERSTFYDRLCKQLGPPDTVRKWQAIRTAFVRWYEQQTAKRRKFMHSLWMGHNQCFGRPFLYGPQPPPAPYRAKCFILHEPPVPTRLALYVGGHVVPPHRLCKTPKTVPLKNMP